MEALIEFLKDFHPQTLIGMGIMLWYFSRQMKKEHKEDIERLEKRTEIISKRTDDLYMMFIKLLEKK